MKKIRHMGAIAIVIILTMSVTLTVFGAVGVEAAASTPSAPQNLSATAGSAQIVLKWTASTYNGGATITGYKVYRSTASGAETLLTTVGNVVTYTNTGLSNGQTYYYKVSAVNSAGVGWKSNEAKATPAASSSSTTSTSSSTTSSSSSVAAKVLVYVSGSTYYAENVATGAAITSGSDARTVIQAAISKLTSGRTTMEKVLLQGSFNLRSGISLPSYTILELDGTVTATASYENMIYSSGSHNIEVSGGIWNQNGYAGNNPNTILFENCQYVSVHDCDVRTGSITVKITSHATIANNKVSNSAGSGIAVLLTCSDITITGNTLTDDNAGIYLYCQRGDGRADIIENCEVDHNTVTRTQTDGISLYPEGSEDMVRNCVVTSNVCIDCGIDGNHPGIAVGVGGGTDPTLVGSVDYNTISYNTVSETGNYRCGGGIAVRGDHNTVNGNTIKNTYDPGLAIYNGNYNTLDSNVVNGVRSGSGVEICDASNNIVSNNQISNTAGAGIWITGAQFSSYYSNNNDIKGNTISGTGSSRIYISESGNTGNIIESNTFVSGSSISNRGTGTVIRNNINA